MIRGIVAHILAVLLLSSVKTFKYGINISINNDCSKGFSILFNLLINVSYSAPNWYILFNG